MKNVIPGLLILLLALAALKGNSQGCSDAGVCTIHSIKNNTTTAATNKTHRNELSVGFAFGKGERDISIYTPYLEYSRRLDSNTSLTGKINYNIISGELAKTNGPGDIFLSLDHAFDNRRQWKKSFIAGLKFPFSSAGLKKQGVDLPMTYQTSLGTIDFVAGLNLSRKSLGITIALQQPLQKSNGNRFLPENYPSVPLASKYLPTNRFLRKGDMLVRVSQNIKLNEKWSVRPSLLSIYHLGNDSYIGLGRVRKEIRKSSGLTLNANAFITYKVKSGSELELSVGTPFVIRTNRPDGLTRSLVASVEYHFSF